MFDSRLIQVFLSLNKEEKRKIRKWINNRFVNENDDISRFFEFIDSRKKITEKSVTKQKAHDYIYPNTPFNDLRIRHLLWLTTEIMEDFIVFTTSSKKLGLKERLLTDFYIQKGLYPFANSTIIETQQKIEKENIRNALFYRVQYDLGISYYDINSRNTRTKDFNYNNTIYSFTAYTIIEVLKSACIVNTIQRIMEFNDQQFLLGDVLALLPNSDFLQIPIIRIYYNTYLFVSTESETAFESFLLDIKQHESLFSFYDLNNLYRMAINFCIKKSNQNLVIYTEKTFELYLYVIRKGILTEDHELNRFAFTNTVSVGIKLKEFAKVNAFIKEFSNQISKPYRKNTIDFNTAKIFYATQQPDKALNILLTNEFKDTLWNLNAKFLMLKILFERKEVELFASQLKAFKTYVSRQRSIGYHKSYFTNVGNAFSKLIDVEKNPKKYTHPVFDQQTPEFDWFNNAVNLRSSKKK